MTKQGAIEVMSKLLKYSELNRKEFSQKVGIKNPQWIADVMNANKKVGISKDKAERICRAFPEINEAWLLTGEGAMLKGGVRNEVEDLSSEEMSGISDGLKNGHFRLVPLINIDSVGGIHSGNSIDISEQYVIKMLPFADALPDDVAILQSGNSMYPTIPAGSALLIREVKDWREYFGYGGIFVLLLKDGRRITKEVRRYEEDPKNYVWCVSYNPDVADEELPKSLITGVWKVVKYIADFGW